MTNTATRLPKNIRIVSWNYDFQFEIALSEYTLQSQLKGNQDVLQSTNRQSPFLDVSSGFSIFKLNGTPSILNEIDRSYEILAEYKRISSQNLIHTLTLKEIIAQYARCQYHKIKNFGLTFAWERMNPDFINLVEAETKDTNVLVIIGYSFPYFNRQIDKSILSKMNPDKIYIQSKEPNEVIDRINATIPIIASKFIRITDLNQFLIPPELD